MIKKRKKNYSVFNFFFLVFSPFPVVQIVLFVPSSSRGGPGSSRPLHRSVPDKRTKKETEPSNPLPSPHLKAYELVENEQTNEQNTTVNSSQKESTDTQNSKNTVLFFFFFLFFSFLILSFFITVVPPYGQYHRRGLSPGVLIWRQWSGPPPPAAQWNWEAALQSAGQFSSDILSLNFTVW